ncbi:MAG: hypothetical protein ACFN4R_05495, partial [Streptococcus gordonii]
RILRHVLHPRRIVVREARRVDVHIVARGGLSDDEDDRARRARGERIRLNGLSLKACEKRTFNY